MSRKAISSEVYKETSMKEIYIPKIVPKTEEQFNKYILTEIFNIGYKEN
jgi:hypothetical protein